MKYKLGIVSVLAGCILLIAGCGNGDGTLSGGGGSGPTPTEAVLQLGSGSGSSFQAGVLSIAPAQLSAGGSAQVSAILQYSDGSSYTKSAVITFTSTCYVNGLAVFEVSGVAGNIVTATSGQATITYTAQGCRGSDIIKATTTIDGKSLSAQGVVTVAGAVQLGSGIGASFVPGALDIVNPQISLGGSTTISATLQYTDGTLYTDSATLVFTSPCYQQGLASFAVNGAPTNKVSTSNGRAIITYTAKGCAGLDVITATTTALGVDLSAQGGVTISGTSTLKTVQFGSVSGGTFQQGALTIAPAQLSADGAATVSAALQYSDGTAYTGVAIVTFTSPCYQSGLSAFTVNGTAGNAVTTTTGQVQIVYTADGCRGSDIIKATTSVQGNDLSAQGVATVAASVLLGSGSGSAFQSGALQITNSQLQAGGSTNILANLQYTDGTAYTGSASLAFTSPCYQQGLASFTVNGVPGNTVTTNSGEATITYTANGCAGQDVITATTTVEGNNLSATGGLTVAPAVQFGSTSSGAFQQGVLALGLNQISAGGSTSITGTLRYSDGTPYTDAAVVTFTSPCYQGGQAEFLVGGNPDNTVTATAGQVTITYTAKGCSGADTVTAQTMLNDILLSATGTVTVAPAAIGSMQFISVSPSVVSLQGAGGQTTSTVVFQVADSSGGPVPNAHVTFALSTTVGGITLVPASATTGSDGRVQTIVNAGTQHTTVRVTAATTTSGGKAISTQSDPIVISTGLADQNHFSLSISQHNTETFNIDGIKETVTVILSDRYGNPVPDGTTVSFTTNGGQIENSCSTAGNPGTSSCSVTWTSANPRPIGTGGRSVIGHAEILAYTTGEESFTDANGNGVFDGSPPDIFTEYPGAPAPGDEFFGQVSYNDIGEVYLDENQNGIYDTGEYYFDFNNNGVRNAPDGTFHGIGCPDSGKPNCGNTHNFGVGQQACIVMTTSTVLITGPISVAIGGQAIFQVSDRNGNVPPAGMTFSVVPSSSDVKVTLLQTEVPDIAGCPVPPASYAITAQVASDSAAGSFRIKAVSPSGVVSYSNSITVN